VAGCADSVCGVGSCVYGGRTAGVGEVFVEGVRGGSGVLGDLVH